MQDYAKSLAQIALEIKAIKLDPVTPFTWASGYRMPIYNDNRLLLGNYKHRALISEGFQSIIETQQLPVEVIAGTSTAGISPGTTLADRLKLPFIYVRDKAKGHGMQNRIEGILTPGQKALMVEDLVSTGGSSIEAIKAVREAEGTLDNCLSIFSYGLEEATKQFDAISCRLFPLLTFDVLLSTAVAASYITAPQKALLDSWREDPFGWGEKHGFPRVIKS